MEQRRLHATYATTTPNKVIEVVVDYRLGVRANGNIKPRGIYVAVNPIEYRGEMKVYTGYSGSSDLALEMERFNRRAFDKFVPQPEQIDRLMEDVLARNGLTLTGEVANG